MLEGALTALLGLALRQARKRVTWLWWPVVVIVWWWRRSERRQQKGASS